MANDELGIKIKIVARRLNLGTHTFTRMCILDYLYRNRHLVPTKDELAKDIKALEDLKKSPAYIAAQEKYRKKYDEWREKRAVLKRDKLKEQALNSNQSPDAL